MLRSITINAGAVTLDIDGVEYALGDVPEGALTEQELAEVSAAQQCVTPGPTPEQQLAALESAIDQYLDSVAKRYTFNDRTRLALRAGYPNDWQALGTAFGTWMDRCNALVAAGRKEIIDGTMPIPTAEEMIAALPEFVAS